MGSLLSNNSEINDIYTNFIPAVNNIFEVEIFSYTNNFSIIDNNQDLVSDKIYNHGKYHITNVTLDNAESISLSRHNVTKKFFLDNSSYTWFDIVTLTWREDKDFTVRDFHEAWLKQFYDRDRDCFISSDPKKAYERFKEIHIKFPGRTLVLKKVLPQSIPALSTFSWGHNGNIVTYNLSYYVESWQWENQTV